MKFNHNWLLAIGIAIPALFPEIAHSKPADEYICPPRDEMCQLVDASLRKHVDKPAQKPIAKPKPAPSVRSSSAPQAPPVDVRKDAAAAADTARDFRFALAFSR